MDDFVADLDREIIEKCIIAVMRGDFIGAFEFDLRVGYTRRMADRNWRKFMEHRYGHHCRAFVHNCLNEVCNGIMFSSDEWKQWIGYDREVVEGVFRRWGELRRVLR